MKISFIIPAYNVEKYIKKCVKSCTDIGIDNKEIIIVDDGSTDNTYEKISEEYGSVKYIKLYKTENRGLSEARNYGLSHATGDYVVFVDSDDWLEKSIEYLFDERKLTDVDVLYFAAQSIIEEENNKIYSQIPYPFEEEKKYSPKEVFLINNQYRDDDRVYHHAWRGIYRRDFLINNEIKFIPGILYEDNSFWFKVISKAKNIIYTNTVCYNYLIRKESIINSKPCYKNIESIFINIKSMISSNVDYKEYFESVEKKSVIMMNECERRFSDSYLIVEKYKEQIIEWKQKLINQINNLYSENDIYSLKVKYRIVSNLVVFLGVYDEKQLSFVIEMRTAIVSKTKKAMDEWLLRTNRKVGLYGAGVQSDLTINVYERLFGRICSDTFYIDSRKESNKEKLFGRDILNVKDVQKEEPDQIIICSERYGKQMLEQVNSHCPKIPTMFLYDKNPGTFRGVFDHNFIEDLLILNNTVGEKRIILISTPEYPNVGDHLIACSEYEFIKKYFPGYKIIEITNEDYAYFKVCLEKNIKQQDILMITGGGFFGTLWREFHYDDVLDLLRRFSNNSIIAFPQSVYFSNDVIGETYKQLTLNAINVANCYIICRERFSYSKLLEIGVDKRKIALFPDIALYFEYTHSIEKTNNAGLFLRDDKESILSDDAKIRIKNLVEKYGYGSLESSMQYKVAPIHKESRDLAILEKLDEISRYQIVITDQLHCMISCYLTGTKCIALNNISRKLEGVYDWIRDSQYVILANSEKDVEQAILKLQDVSIDESKHLLLDNYWDELYKKIEIFLY